MSRWKAAAIHLSISLLIGLISALLVFGVWYPPPYSRATGGSQLVVLLLSVDLVLGPLLTLVVFKAGKKGMGFDLAVIALLQACALGYGMSVVARARPAFIVGVIDRFTLVSANELDDADLARGSAPEFTSVPWTGPRLAAARKRSAEEADADLKNPDMAGKDVEKLPKYYVSYTTQAAELVKRARELDSLRMKSPSAGPLVDGWLRDHQREPADIVWVPVTAPRSDLAMLLDKKTGEPLDALAIDPW